MSKERESLTAARRFLPLAGIIANHPPSSYPQPWTWDDEERDILARLCLCCGETGHYQAKMEEHIRDVGLAEGICLAEDGRVHDGHHRVIAARRLGIASVPLESRADADARWKRDHGDLSWELRERGDVPPGDAWNWVQKCRATHDVGPLRDRERYT